MIENGSLSSFNETKSSDEINFGTKAVKTIVILAALFISLQVISNVIAGLPISWFPGNKDLIYCASGAILFPFISIISDSISNVFGTKLVKSITKTGMIVNLIFAGICMLVLYWPHPSFAEESVPSYFRVLNQSVIMVIAGIIALYASNVINSLILQAFKRKQIAKGESTTNPKGIYVRSVISSLFAVAADCIIFNFLSFIWSMPLANVIIMCITQYIIKIIIECVCQIFIAKWIVPKIVNYTGIDIVENKQKFI